MAFDESKIPVPDPAPPDFPRLHDIDYFMERLHEAFARVSIIRPYVMEVLGTVGGHDIFLIGPTELQSQGKPYILSAGGFHGEEPAGPWGIVEYLETATPQQIRAVNHSFLPLASPTAFANAQRFNIFGENASWGFLDVLPEHREQTKATNKNWPSREGRILLNHHERLMNLARDGFVTQHEDWTMKEAYLFVNEQGVMPSDFTLALRGALTSYFGLVARDNPLLQEENVRLVDGVAYNHIENDSTYESLLTVSGIPRVATTETPGQARATDRIAANRDVAAAFAEFMAKKNCNPF